MRWTYCWKLLASILDIEQMFIISHHAEQNEEFKSLILHQEQCERVLQEKEARLYS